MGAIQTKTDKIAKNENVPRILRIVCPRRAVHRAYCALYVPLKNSRHASGEKTSLSAYWGSWRAASKDDLTKLLAQLESICLRDGLCKTARISDAKDPADQDPGRSRSFNDQPHRAVPIHISDCIHERGTIKG